MIVVDAFSSDSIPVHLLTKQAVQMYFEHLEDDGVLVLHISNRYLDLKPVAARIAQELGLAAVHQWDTDGGIPGKQSSEWVLVAKKRADFGSLLELTTEVEEDGKTVTRTRWDELKPGADDPLWTDDFTNLLQIFRWE